MDQTVFGPGLRDFFKTDIVSFFSAVDKTATVGAHNWWGGGGLYRSLFGSPFCAQQRWGGRFAGICPHESVGNMRATWMLKHKNY